MKKIIISLLVLASANLMAQKTVILKEDFRNKMEDKKEAWCDFDISTKLMSADATFKAHLCRYFSNSSPAMPCECSKGRVNIEMIKKEDIPYLEFPELPSCGVLKLGVQSNGKDCKRSIALQKIVNNSWVTVDEIEMDAPPTGTCIIWEPKNATSKIPVKFRLVAHKYGNVFVTDVYAEAY